MDKDGEFLHANDEDYDQIARIHRLNGVSVRRSCQKVYFFMLRHIFSPQLKLVY